MLRILTRPWSEDSSTPIGKNNRKTDREEQRERQTKQATTKKANSTTHNQTKQKGGGRGGASVEKPDTSLARQFKHPERKLEGSNQIPRTLRLRSNG